MLKKIIKVIRSKVNSILYVSKLTSKKIHCLGKLRISGNKIDNRENVVFYDNVKIINNGKLFIGKNVKIGDNVIIYCNNSIHIGDNTIIAANSYMIDCDHGISRELLIAQQPLENGEVYIGNDCWIGEDVTITRGAYISDGCVIGAKALVRTKISPYKVAVGIPAKEIKERV